MEKFRLNPEALVVSSFEPAEPAAYPGSITTDPFTIEPVTTTTDPTALTHCYICPARTTDCPLY